MVHARRLWTLAIFVLAIGVAIGSWRSWLLTGGVPALIGTRYGRLQLLRWILFLAALGTAAAAWIPRPARPGPLGPLKGALIEVVLALGILTASALLAAAPGARESPTWPFTFRLAPQVTWEFPGVKDQALTGTGYLALGLLALIAGWRSRRWRPLSLALAAVLLPWGLYTALAPMALDAYPTTYVRSPVLYGTASVARGHRLFAEHCGTCHGARGQGDGPAADSLLQRPADLTASHTGDHTAGDIYWWLTNGLGLVMPAFGDRLSVDERWDVISFIRALGAGEGARALTGVVSARRSAVVAPDFPFATATLDGHLRDYRGRQPVLLVLFTWPGSARRLADLERTRGDLANAGARVLAVPMDGADGVASDHAAAPLDGLPIVTRGSTAITDTYTLFARTQLPAGSLPNPPPPAHAEVLIDKAGYLRARWIVGERQPGWGDVSELLKQIRALAVEANSSPASDEVR